jgi:hypothetical protein
MQLDDRTAADKFVADEPMNKAGVYQCHSSSCSVASWSISITERCCFSCQCSSDLRAEIQRINGLAR